MTNLPNPNEIIERILGAAKTALPDSVSNDIKENIRSAIQEVVNDLDVVTREEFDVQKKVLLKTRKKLEELEKLFDQQQKSK